MEIYLFIFLQDHFISSKVFKSVVCNLSLVCVCVFFVFQNNPKNLDMVNKSRFLGFLDSFAEKILKGGECLVPSTGYDACTG